MDNDTRHQIYRAATQADLERLAVAYLRIRNRYLAGFITFETCREQQTAFWADLEARKIAHHVRRYVDPESDDCIAPDDARVQVSE